MPGREREEGEIGEEKWEAVGERGREGEGTWTQEEEMGREEGK